MFRTLAAVKNLVNLGRACKSIPVHVTGFPTRWMGSLEGVISTGNGSNAEQEGDYHARMKSRRRWAVSLATVSVIGLGCYLSKSRCQNLEPGEISHESIVTTDDEQEFSLEEVSQHNSPDKGIWVTYKGNVYDITDFVTIHPGGDKIMQAAGKSLEPFWSTYTIHGNEHIHELLRELKIGRVKGDSDSLRINTECPYKNEPTRSSNFNVNSYKPFDAEPYPELLVKHYITSNENFYVRNHLPVPVVDPDEYKLQICVKDREVLNLSLKDLKEKFSKHTIMATLQCAGNRRAEMADHKPISGAPGGISAISNATWSGVLLRDVLHYAGLNEDDQSVKHIEFEGLDADPSGDPYAASIPVEKAMDYRGDTLLAYEMNGETLPRDHGFPLRVVVPGIVGARNVKWLSRIIASEEESQSHWHQKDYKSSPPSASWEDFNFDKAPAIQEAPVQSAICYPADGTVVGNSEEVTIKGYAWSGGGNRVLRVDVTIDGGKTWKTAEIEQAPQRLYRAWAWTLWTVSIPIPAGQEGPMNIQCKAVDSSHNVQPENLDGIWNLRGFVNNSWHKITINVSKCHMWAGNAFPSRALDSTS